MQTTYIIVPIIIIIVILIVALEDNLYEKNYTLNTYFKIILLLGSVSTGLIYANNIPVPSVSEEILKGPAPF
jgi:hypothetical protein